MRHYCTYFDSNYILQGLALYHSLYEHSREPFTFWVLCFDQLAYQILDELSLPHMRLIAQDEFERGNKALLQAKMNRNRVEYYWTCTPSLPLFVLEQNPQINLITYLDADLFFFSDPEVIFSELASGSILIVGHRFPPWLKEKEIFGIYNVGLLSFRRDANGLAALKWWQERCNEWCYMYLENGRYADQKYLDDWPTRFRGVVVLQNKGAGLAPWNLGGCSFSVDNEGIWVCEDPLVFYHFHRFKMITSQVFGHGTELYSRTINEPTLQFDHVRHLYVPYAKRIKALRNKINKRFPEYQSKINIVSLNSLTRGLSKGKYFFAVETFFSDLFLHISLWRGWSDALAHQGFQSHSKGDRINARHFLLGAAVRSPLLLLDPKFWQVLKT